MGIFGSILASLGLGGLAPGSPSPTAPTAGAAPAAPSAPATAPAAATASPTLVAAVPVVDVEAHMEQLAKATGHEVNWRESIVDLLSLLGIDNSLAARKELATELGCPPDLMQDSARMNVWLHKQVMLRVAANGGAVPQNLLD